MPLRIVLLSLLCLFVFAGRAAHAAPHERPPDGKDLKRAESLLSKLHQLEAAGDSDAFGKTARKLYPGLFNSVSKLRDGDLKTDLATAVTLYESALRATREANGNAPDCSRELRYTYSRLCLENASGGRALLLRAKARLHAHWAETELAYARGNRDAATLDSMSLIRAERGIDLALAEEALHVLKEAAEALSNDASALSTGASSAKASSAKAFGRNSLASEQTDGLSASLSGKLEEVAGRLEEVERILASLPRTRANQLLRNARDAFRDGLYWQLKTLPSRSLVVNASSFNANSFDAPDTLPQLDLRADDAEHAALCNLRSALKFINRAEEAVATMNAER